jgi:hypothetical protein
MIKIYAFILVLQDKKSIKRILFHEIGTDFYDIVEKAKTKAAKDFNFPREDVEVSPATDCITLEQVLDAAKLDLKDLVKQARLADDVNSLEEKL